VLIFPFFPSPIVLSVTIHYCKTSEEQRQYCCSLAASDGSDETGDAPYGPPSHNPFDCRRCPDCNGHMLPHDHFMCKCYDSDAYDASASSYESDSSGTEAASSGGQSPTSRANIWPFIVAGALVAMLIAALIMRKRVSKVQNCLKVGSIQKLTLTRLFLHSELTVRTKQLLLLMLTASPARKSTSCQATVMRPRRDPTLLKWNPSRKPRRDPTLLKWNPSRNPLQSQIRASKLIRRATRRPPEDLGFAFGENRSYIRSLDCSYI